MGRLYRRSHVRSFGIIIDDLEISIQLDCVLCRTSLSVSSVARMKLVDSTLTVLGHAIFGTRRPWLAVTTVWLHGP
jgi:hypothetical protein